LQRRAPYSFWLTLPRSLSRGQAADQVTRPDLPRASMAVMKEIPVDREEGLAVDQQCMVLAPVCKDLVPVGGVPEIGSTCHRDSGE
jgi:hypothetical protein